MRTKIKEFAYNIFLGENMWAGWGIIIMFGIAHIRF